MNRKILSVFGFLLMIPAMLSGVDTGELMPEIEVEKWLYQTSGRESDMEVVILLDVTARDALNLLKTLETFQAETLIPVKAVAMNPRETTEAFAKANGPFQLYFGADRNLRTRKSLASEESLFPYAIVAKNGRVMWSGHPAEVDGVTVQVRAGTFSPATQKKVEVLRRELQMAIQSGLPQVISSTADKILVIAPGDRIAIQAKLMSLSSTGRMNDSIAFLAERCRKVPWDVKLRLMYFDLLIRNGKMEEFRKEVLSFEKTFSAKNPVLVWVGAYLMNQAPYGILSPEIIQKLVERGLKGCDQQKKDSLVHAIAYETLARCSALTGKFDCAIEQQKQAVAFRKGTPLEKNASARLEYYMLLKQLSKQK